MDHKYLGTLKSRSSKDWIILFPAMSQPSSNLFHPRSLHCHIYVSEIVEPTEVIMHIVEGNEDSEDESSNEFCT